MMATTIDVDAISLQLDLLIVRFFEIEGAKLQGVSILSKENKILEYDCNHPQKLDPLDISNQTFFLTSSVQVSS